MPGGKDIIYIRDFKLILTYVGNYSDIKIGRERTAYLGGEDCCHKERCYAVQCAEYLHNITNTIIFRFSKID